MAKAVGGKGQVQTVLSPSLRCEFLHTSVEDYGTDRRVLAKTQFATQLRCRGRHWRLSRESSLSRTFVRRGIVSWLHMYTHRCEILCDGQRPVPRQRVLLN